MNVRTPLKKILFTGLATLGVMSSLTLADQNIDFLITPVTQSAISGSTVNFRFGMRSNTGVQCTGAMTYTLPSQFVVDDRRRNWDPGVLDADISMNPNQRRNRYQSITGHMDLVSWSDNSRYLTLNGSYVCSGGVIGSEVVRAEIEPMPDLVVDKTLTSWNPSKTGDLVTYNVRVYNRGSATASNYRFYERFPHEYLEDFSAVFGPFGYRAETVDGTSQRYFWEGSYLNLLPGRSLDITVSGRLKSSIPDDGPFNNSAWVQDLANEYTTGNNRDGAQAEVEHRDMTMSFTPSVQTAISGEQLSFVIGMQNPGDFNCDADVRYIMPNNGLDLVSSSRPIASTIWDEDIAFTPGQTRNNYLTLVADVDIQSWNKSGLYITAEVRYDCGFGEHTLTERAYVNPAPELEVSKELISGNPGTVGELVEYRVRISNVGSAPAVGYTLYEDFPLTHLESVSARIGSINYSFSLVGGVYTLDANTVPALNVAAGSYVDVYVSGNLKSITDKSVFTNTSWIELAGQYRNQNNTGFADAQVEVEDVSMNITPSVQYAISGSELSFEVSMSNNGDVACTGELRYELPDGDIVYVNSSNAEFTKNIHAVIPLPVSVTPVDYSNITGRVIIENWNDNSLYVTLHGKYDCGAGWIDLADERAEIEPIADIQVTKERTSVQPSHTGDLVEYTIVLENVGSARAENYRFYDLLPSTYLELVSVTFDGVERPPVHLLAGEYYWDGSFLDVNAGNTITIVVTGRLRSNQDTSVFSNVARIDLLNPEYDTTNNSDDADAQVQRRDVEFIVTPSVQYAISGSTIGFDIGIRSNSSVDCTGDLVYTFPTGIEWRDSSGVPGNGFLPSTPVTDIVMPVGFSNLNYAHLTGEVRLQNWADDTLYITVEGRYDCGAGRETVTTQIEIEPVADLVVTKTMTTTNPGSANDLVEYLIALENVGSTAAVGYRFFDALPAELNFESASFGNLGTYNPSLMANTSWYFWEGTYLNIQPGQTMNVIVRGRLKADQCIGQALRNDAWDDLRPQYYTGDDTDFATGRVDSPDLSVTLQVVGPMPENFNDPVTFRIDYANNGNIATSGVVLRGMMDNEVNGLTSTQRRSPEPTQTTTGRRLAWPMGQAGLTIDPGQSGYIIVTGYLNSNSYVRGTEICLSVEIGDPDYLENICNIDVDNSARICQITTGEIVDLAIQKKLLDDVLDIQKDDLISYRLDFINTGEFAVSGIVVRDFLPTYLDYTSAQVYGSSGTPSCQLLAGIVNCSNIELAPNQRGYILITGQLLELGVEGLVLENRAKISSSAREFFTGNNVAVSVDTIPGLGDLVVTKIATGVMPAVEGDLIRYEFTVKNEGARTVENIHIEDHILASTGLLRYYESYYPAIHWFYNQNYGYWGGVDQPEMSTLAPGAEFSFVLTGRLQDSCSAGAELPNRVFVTTTSAQVTTGNDYAYATGYVRSETGIDVSMFVYNEDVTLNGAKDAFIDGYSGQQYRIEIIYENMGNMIEERLYYNLRLNGRVLSTDVGFIDVPCGSGGKIVYTGIISYPEGVSDLPVVLSYTDLGVSEQIDGNIHEPLVCGDGYITGPEKCDMDGPIGQIYPGQLCRVQNDDINLGCELITASIVNTGCVNYSYKMNGMNLTGGYCDNMEPVRVDNPVCETATILDKRQVGLSGLNVDIECKGLEASSTTKIELHCNNDSRDVYVGYGDKFTETCYYEGAPGQSLEPDDLKAQCIVADDDNEPNCVVDVDYRFDEEPELLCDLNVEPSLSIDITFDEYERTKGVVEVVCKTQDGSDVATGDLKISCNYDPDNISWDEESIAWDDSITTLCSYPDDRVDVDLGDDEEYQIYCHVEGSENVCEDTVDVEVEEEEEEEFECGNGILERGEDCDLGEAAWIDEYLDEEENEEASRRHQGKLCNERCEITEVNGVYTAPACFKTVASLSVEQGDDFPFYWSLDKSTIKESIGDNYVSSCDDVEIDPDQVEGELIELPIVEDSIKCHFKLYGPRDQEKSLIGDLELDCFDEDQWDDLDVSVNLKDYFENEWGADSIDEGYGKGILEDFLGDIDEEDIDLGEYKLALDQVTYEYCEPGNSVSRHNTLEFEDEDGEVYNRVCEVNFAVTKSYLMQKSAFGATMDKESGWGVDLDQFYAIDTEDTDDGMRIMDRSDLRDIMEESSSSYTLNKELEDSVQAFIDKYSKLAISATTNPLNGLDVKKVPGRHIYVFDTDEDVIIEQKTDNYPTESYTVIVTKGNLIISGSVVTNGMFIVDGGTITFEGGKDNCGTQEVNGIFIAHDGRFKGSNEWDNTVSSIQDNGWCAEGSLHVKGVLIGAGLEDIVKSKRSHLNQWFKVDADPDEARKQRREYLFDGAAVLIEYNPSLWKSMPPGAEEFTEALEVYKK